jgi:chromosome segregation ATPase
LKIDLQAANDYVDTQTKAAEASNGIRLHIEKRLNEMNGEKKQQTFHIATIDKQNKILKKEQTKLISKIEEMELRCSKMKCVEETALTDRKVIGAELKTVRQELQNKIRALRELDSDSGRMYEENRQMKEKYDTS